MAAEYKEVKVTEPTALFRSSQSNLADYCSNTVLLSCYEDKTEIFYRFYKTQIKAPIIPRLKGKSNATFTNFEIFKGVDEIVDAYAYPINEEFDEYDFPVKMIPRKVFKINAEITEVKKYTPKFFIDEETLNDISLV